MSDLRKYMNIINESIVTQVQETTEVEETEEVETVEEGEQLDELFGKGEIFGQKKQKNPNNDPGAEGYRQDEYKNNDEIDSHPRYMELRSLLSSAESASGQAYWDLQDQITDAAKEIAQDCGGLTYRSVVRYANMHGMGKRDKGRYYDAGTGEWVYDNGRREKATNWPL